MAIHAARKSEFTDCRASCWRDVVTRRILMLAYQWLPSRTELLTRSAFLSMLEPSPVAHAELQELVGILQERTSLAPLPLTGAPEH